MAENISKLAKEALNNRLLSSENYSLEEINSVSNYNSKLFNEDFTLDCESSILLRNLCTSSNLSKTLNIKKSHRPIIGPVIFFMKKLLCRVINPLMKTQFDQIESFNTNTVQAIAKLYNNGDSPHSQELGKDK